MKKSTKKKPVPSVPEWPSSHISEQVQRAWPMAREILTGHGIACDPTPSQEQLYQRVAAIMDDDSIAQYLDNCRGEELVRWATRLEAAQALGIALGLLMRPEAFGIGGARCAELGAMTGSGR